MDKYEYQVCADQIKELASQGRYAEAMDIADTIDWRRVKSFSMLCTVSEIYKVNKHYDESREILLLAYERYPDRSSVIYALCELDIKLGDIEEAKEFYKEFCSLKPRDTNRYVLLYRLYEAMDYTLEDKISLLEEFKRNEYTEKWAYELALLYHKTGQEKKCVETCDEMIIWFGDGNYVRKAMELKMQHAELTEDQQRKYEGVDIPQSTYQEPTYTQDTSYQQQSYEPYNGAMQQNYDSYQNQLQATYDPYAGQPQATYDPYAGQPQAAYDPYAGQSQYVQQNPYQNGYAQQPYDNYQGIQVQPVSTGKYSTINLQEELARNMQEVYGRDANIPNGYYGNTASLYEPSQREYMQQLSEAGALEEDNSGYGPDMQYESGNYRAEDAASEAVSVMPVPTMAESNVTVPDAKSITAPIKVEEPVRENKLIPGLGEEVLANVNNEPVQDEEEIPNVEPVVKEPVEVEAVTAEPVITESVQMQPIPSEPVSVEPVNVQPVVAEPIQSQPVMAAPSSTQRELDKVLSQEYNGQISLSLPDPDMEIKQITGQIDISDFLKEWEEKKKLGQQQRMEETKKRQMEQTSDIMSQLVGVIPGIEIKKPEENVKELEVPLRKEEVVRSDDNGTLTKTTLKAPSYDNREPAERVVKRTETGSIINGPLKSGITGQIPDVLPSAPEPSVGIAPSLNITKTEEKPVEKYVRPEREEPKPIVIPDYILNQDDEEDSNIEPVKQVEDIAKDNYTDEPMEESVEEAIEEPVMEKPGMIPGLIPEPDFLKPFVPNMEEEQEPTIDEQEDEPEEIPVEEEVVEEAIPTEEAPVEEAPTEEATEEESIEETVEEEVKEDLPSQEYTEEEWKLPELPGGMVSPKKEEEKEETKEEVVEESERFPFDLTSELDPVEDLVDVEQSDDVEDLLKTGAIPLFDIDPEALESNNSTEEDKRPSVPTYMNMDELNNRREARREFDYEERRIFGRFEGIESLKAQIVDVMEDMSMEAAVGNVVVTGSEIYGRKSIAINIVKAIQIFDTSFSGKVAKISGEALNKKDIPMTLHKLHNGALIVENAGGLSPLTVNTIIETLTQGAEPILVVFEDEKDAMEPLLVGCQDMKKVFNARIEIADFSNNDLVAYANGYAREQEYSIDEMGEMELHTRIDELQSSIDDVVTVDDVKEIVDNAIRHVDRKNMSHFMDVLVGKRYDDDDYIVLRAKDFQN